jgi:hypothetical protein
VRHRARWVVPEYRRYVLDAARQRLAMSMPSGVGEKVAVHVAAGSPDDTIRAHAASTDADLIVTASEDRCRTRGRIATSSLDRPGRSLQSVSSMHLSILSHTLTSRGSRARPRSLLIALALLGFCPDSAGRRSQSMSRSPGTRAHPVPRRGPPVSRRRPPAKCFSASDHTQRLMGVRSRERLR